MPEQEAGTLRVTLADGVVVLEFTATEVIVRLPCDAARIPLKEWDFVAKVYGNRSKTTKKD